MSLDSRIRDVLQDNSFALPGWEDPVARVGRGIRRRRRNRRVLGGAAFALLLAIPTILWLQPLRNTTTPGVDAPIAFLDGPEAAAPAYLARRSPRADAKPCEHMHDHPWLRQDWSRPDVTTVMLPPAPSMERCTLRANTTLTAINTTTGQMEEFTLGGATPPGAWQTPATVDGAEPARLDIIAGRDCGQRFEDFRLTVLGVTYELEHTTECRPAVTTWYVEPPLLNAPLTVSMKAPATVQRGQWFDYIVTVLSPMGAYALHECPVYLQRLNTKAVWRRLNCDKLKSFPAHTPVRFTMRAYVPPDQQPGQTKLSWMAVMSDGKVAIADIATDGVMVDVL